MYKFASGLVGVIISVMVAFNGVLAIATGNYLAAVIIHLTGMIAIILLLVIRRVKIKFNRELPIYFYSAGVVGVATILLNNLCFKNMSVSAIMALGLLGQTVCSGVIDNYGLFGAKVQKFKKEKLLGLGIISLGIAVMFIY